MLGVIVENFEASFDIWDLCDNFGVMCCVFMEINVMGLFDCVFFAISATQEHESQFVEVGYIANVHGLQGEARVKPTTDFPELRFAKVEND